jgi:hypothetical protein
MSYQTVHYDVWLGVAALGFIWADIDLRRRGRALTQTQEDHGADQTTFVPSAAAEMINPAATR